MTTAAVSQSGRISGAMLALTASSTLSDETPWPGLESFREGDAPFFRGRDETADELFRLVRRERFSLLHGLSGLGKSSVLQAGLFPRLRADQLHLPVYVRLRYDSDAAPLREQILNALKRAADQAGLEAPQPDVGRTLWEHFHFRDGGYWTTDNRLVIPVIVIDQFEEAFTIGRDGADRSTRTAAFLDELGDLIEGRAPMSVKARIADAADARAFDLTRHDYKILVTIREDFLAELETLGPVIPSVMGSNRNRMRLEPLRGTAALLVVQAGGSLVTQDVCERIVALVSDSKSPTLSSESLASMFVDPALLSLFCRELNERRLRLGSKQITPDLVEGRREEILAEFYARATQNLGPAVRRFIEDNLIVLDGARTFRNSEARAIARNAGVTDAEIDSLVTGRLIRVIEGEGRLPRLELTHDVLGDVVRRSLEARRAQDQLDAARAQSERAQVELVRQRAQIRRSRMATGIVTGIALLAVAGFVWAWRATLDARRARAMSDFRHAAQSAQAANPFEALALVAAAARRDPDRSTMRGLALTLVKNEASPSLRIPTVGVMSAVFSPDGERILTASFDNTARLWDVHTGAQVGPVFRQAYRLSSAAFSLDGKRIVTASLDGTAQVWDAATGSKIGVELKHRRDIWSAVFSPDGQRVLTSSGDSTARLWDAATGVELRVFAAAAVVNDAEFSPDARSIVLATEDAAQTWDVETGLRLNELMVGRIMTARFSPDGERVLIGAVSGATIFDLKTRGRLRLDAAQVRRAVYSADGARVVTASWDSTARVWDAYTGEQVGAPLRHQEMVTAAAFSPNGESIVTSVLVDGAQLWPTPPAWPLGVRPVFQFTDWIRYGDFSPDGRLFVVGGDDSTAQIWETRVFDAAWHAVRHRGEVEQVRFSPDGSRFVTASDDSTAQLWDARTGERLGRPMVHGTWVFDAEFSPDGQRLITASGKIVRQWDGRTGALVGEILHTDQALASIDVSRDGRFLVTGGLAPSSTGVAQVWDASTHAAVGPPLQQARLIRVARFSPDGRRVLTASTDGTAQLWATTTGAKIGEPLQHAGALWTAAFSPDGKHLVTAGADSVASVWDVATGQRVGSPLRHPRTVASATFSPDGRYLATGDSRGTIRLWDVQSSKMVGPPVKQARLIQNLSFSPDGRWLATASADGTAQLWEAKIFQTVWRELRHRDIVNTVRFSRDGRRVVTASFDSSARVWDAQTGLAVGKPLVHNDLVMTADLSPDGTRVVTGTNSRVAQIWDLATATPIGKPIQEKQIVRDVRYSPRGDRFVTTSNDGIVRVWDAETGAPVSPELVHGAGVARANFSADGNQVLTASDDATAQLWNVTTGARVGARLWALNGLNMMDANFSPDGQRVVTASGDRQGAVQLWEISTGTRLGMFSSEFHGRVRRAVFSPDGQTILAAGEDNTVHLLDVPTGDRRDADAIADLAEAVAWQRLDSRGDIIRLSVDERSRLIRTLRTNALNARDRSSVSLAAFLRRLFADTTTAAR